MAMEDSVDAMGHPADSTASGQFVSTLKGGGGRGARAHNMDYNPI